MRILKSRHGVRDVPGADGDLVHLPGPGPAPEASSDIARGARALDNATCQ